MIFKWVVAFWLLLPAPASALCLTGFSATATAMNFGYYAPGASLPTTTSGQVKVNCIVGVLPSFKVTLSKGAGTFSARKMTAGGGGELRYNLYKDGARSLIWGDGSAGTSINEFSGLISLLSTSFDMFGAIEPGQYPAATSFNDLITVTVIF